MRHESKYKFLFYTCLWVISCTQSACSQDFNALHHQKKPFIIKSSHMYKKSISTLDYKRIVPLKNYITPLFSELKYATTDNFTKVALYKNPVLFARLHVAEALKMFKTNFMLKD